MLRLFLLGENAKLYAFLHVLRLCEIIKKASQKLTLVYKIVNHRFSKDVECAALSRKRVDKDV